MRLGGKITEYSADVRVCQKCKKIPNINTLLEILEEMGVEEETLHRFIRLSHWAAFEEPKKRYTIEGGVIDYLFRELVFQDVRETLSPELNVDFCLQLNQTDFLEHLRRLENV